MNSKNNNIEDATIETITEQMDKIVAATNQYETINCLLSCIAVELGLPKESEVKEIFMECGQSFLRYQEAQKNFAEIRKNGKK